MVTQRKGVGLGNSWYDEVTLLIEGSFNQGVTHPHLLYADPDDFDTFFEAYLLTPSDPRACFNITIQDDDVLEPAEYLSVTLDVVELPPAATLNTNVANVRIEDNDRELLDETLTDVQLSIFLFYRWPDWDIQHQFNCDRGCWQCYHIYWLYGTQHDLRKYHCGYHLLHWWWECNR